MRENKSFTELLLKGLWNKFKSFFKFLFWLLGLCAMLIFAMVIATNAYESTDVYQSASATYHLKQEPIEYIYTNDINNPELLSQIDNFIKEQPSYIQKRFKDQSWHVVIGRELPSDLLNEVDLIGIDGNAIALRNYDGLTIPDAKVIFVSTKKEGANLYENFLHEFGHCVDYLNGYASTTYKFEKIYKENASLAFFTDYERSSGTEFYAATYKMYKLTPTVLQNNFPELYQYFEKTDKYNEKTLPLIQQLVSGSMGTIEKGKMFIRSMLNDTMDFRLFND